VRLLALALAALVLTQCASSEERRFSVGVSPKALVVIGVAKTADNRDPRYTMLWRRLNDAGRFSGYDGARIIEPRTNADGSVRVRGIPGEFLFAEVEPGTYALDSVFAALREDNLDYIAQGVVAGPERPAFEVRAGEAVYLGIWELDIDGVSAVTRRWRLADSDLQAVSRAGEPINGQLQARETSARAVACTPHRLNTMSLRLVC
jgi:hypothetical protein